MTEVDQSQFVGSDRYAYWSSLMGLMLSFGWLISGQPIFLFISEMTLIISLFGYVPRIKDSLVDDSKRASAWSPLLFSLVIGQGLFNLLLLLLKILPFGLPYVIQVAVIITAFAFSKNEALRDLLEAKDFGLSDADSKKAQDAEPGSYVIGTQLDTNGDEVKETSLPVVLHLQDRYVHMLVLGVTGTGKTSQTLTPMMVSDFNTPWFESGELEVPQLGQVLFDPKADFAEQLWAMGQVKADERKENYISFLLAMPEKLNNKIIESTRQVIKLRKVGEPRPVTGAEATELASLQKMFQASNYTTKPLKDQLAISNRILQLQKVSKGRELSSSEKEDLRLAESALKNLVYMKRAIIPKITVKLLEVSTPYALLQYASCISRMLARPREIVKETKTFQKIDPTDTSRDLVLYFNPALKDTPYFNPLYGSEDLAMSMVPSTLVSFMGDSPEYFKNLALNVLQKGVSIIKRVFHNDATLVDLNTLLTDAEGKGTEMIKKVQQVAGSKEDVRVNQENAQFFLSDYYSGMNNNKGSKTYEQTSGARSILSKLLADRRLRHALTPPPGHGSDIDFDKILANGDRIAIATQQGEFGQLGQMLGIFLMLQFQSAIFRRPQGATKVPVFTYIDEFQTFATPKFEDFLTQGRSYSVGAVLATQTLDIVKSKAGDGLVKNLVSNARNIIVYPGGSVDDGTYYSKLFGQAKIKEMHETISEDLPDNRLSVKLGFANAKKSGQGPKHSLQEVEKVQDRFDLNKVLQGVRIYESLANEEENKTFGSVMYRIISHASTQPAGAAKVDFIPIELKHELDEQTDAKRERSFLTADQAAQYFTKQEQSSDGFDNEDPLGSSEKDFDQTGFNKKIMNDKGKTNLGVDADSFSEITDAESDNDPDESDFGNSDNPLDDLDLSDVYGDSVPTSESDDE